MALVTGIIAGVTVAYTLLDTYVFKPDKIRSRALTIFNHTDFVRPRDKYNRMPVSLFSKFNNRQYAYGFDKAAIYAGYSNEVLQGYADKNENFNADSLFELYAYLTYTAGGAKAKTLFFDKILNPMFNLSLSKNWTASNRFTAPDRRFFMLLHDYLYLQELAQGPQKRYLFTVYTKNGKTPHVLDAKNYATGLLNIIKEYPFTSGYFVDGLSDVQSIINREVELLTPIVIDKTLQSMTGAQNPVNHGASQTSNIHSNSHTGSPKETPTKAQTKNKTSTYLIMTIIVLVIAVLSFKIFKKIKR